MYRDDVLVTTKVSPGFTRFCRCIQGPVATQISNQAFTLSKLDKEVIEDLRQSGYPITGRIVVRSGPHFRMSHTLSVTEHDNVRVWEINARIDFDEIAAQPVAAASQEIDSTVIDQLQDGTEKRIEEILDTAGARRPEERAKLRDALTKHVSSAAKLLTSRRNRNTSATKDAKSISIRKLDQALKKFIPGVDPQAIAARDTYIDATNKLNRGWLYDCVTSSEDLKSAYTAFEEALTNRSMRVAEDFLAGKVTKGSTSKFIKYIDRLGILETVRTHAHEIDQEIMREYFELRDTPDWKQQKRTLMRARWLVQRCEQRMRKIKRT